MELKNVQAFLTIVETGSFSKAAELLFISQSTISNRIQNLETELNASLFIRNSGKKLCMTSEGEAIYPVLKQGYSLISSAKLTIQQKTNETKEFIISFPAHMAEQIFLKLSKVVNQEFPQHDFSFRLSVSNLAIKGVSSGIIDMGFVYFPPPPNAREIGVEHIADIDTIMVCSPDHRILKKPYIQLSELKDERIIIYNRSFPTYRIFEDFLKQQNTLIDLKLIEVQRIDLIKNMVMEHEGISLLQKASVKEELKKNELTQIRFDQVFPTTPIYLVYKKAIPQNLVQFLVSFAKDLFKSD